jgi:hypothetical protein
LAANETRAKAQTVESEFILKELKPVEEALLKVEKEYADYQTAVETQGKLQAQINETQQKLSAIAPATQAASQLPATMQEGCELKIKHEEAQKIQVAKQTDFTTADQAHRKCVADLAAAREQAKAAKAADLADAEAYVTKQLSEFLAELLALAVEQSVAPLIKTLNELCGGIVNGLVAIQEGELGLIDVSQVSFRSWRSCSDSEQALMSAALRVALATTSPLKICFISRMESLDYEARHKLIQRLIDLVDEGKLHQAILVEVSPTEEPASKRYAGFMNIKNAVNSQPIFNCIEC